LEKETTPKEPVTNSQTPTPALKKRMTLNEFVENAPDEFQEIIRDSLGSAAKERTDLIAIITSNSRNGFTKEALAEMKTDILRGMASLAQNPETVTKTKLAVNYSGAGFGQITPIAQEDPIVANGNKAENMSKPLSTKPEKRSKQTA
jgi:hypothetical protein